MVPVNFLPTTSLDPIMEFVSPLIYAHNDTRLCIGTAVFIGPYIALTAKHVVDEYLSTYGITDFSEDMSLDFNLLLFQQFEDHTNNWVVQKISTVSSTDIAILMVAPANDRAAVYVAHPINLQIYPPREDDEVAMFGYPRTEIARGYDGVFELSLNAHTSLGIVTEVYPSFRDRVLQNFPSFMTNAKIEGGMSGGAVFNQKTGQLLGIVSSSFDTENPPYISSVALLWPILPSVIDFPRDDLKPGEKYRVSELIEKNIIYAPGSENIIISLNPDGTENHSLINPSTA